MEDIDQAYQDGSNNDTVNQQEKINQDSLDQDEQGLGVGVPGNA